MFVWCYCMAVVCMFLIQGNAITAELRTNLKVFSPYFQSKMSENR